MHGLNVTLREISGPISFTLAQDISESSYYGKVVVAASNPISTLSAVRKQWLKLIRNTEKARSSTLDRARIGQLSFEIHRMKSMRFSAKPTAFMEDADVVFANADELARIAPSCTALYITYNFPRHQVYLMTSWMPRNGQVIFYVPKEANK